MKPPKPCRRCGCRRIHRSHRRDLLDRVLFFLGAELLRCPACRYRCASFGFLELPIGDPDNPARSLTGYAVMSSAFLFCLAVTWWLIRRLTDFSG